MTKLEAKVDAVNVCNTEALRYYDKLEDFFRPFVGKKIDKSDGSFVKAVKDGLSFLPNGNRLSVYRMSSNHVLLFFVRLSYQFGDISKSHTASLRIGYIREGVLTGMYTKPDATSDLKTDYDVKLITSLRERRDAAIKAASDIESELRDFGNYDD